MLNYQRVIFPIILHEHVHLVLVIFQWPNAVGFSPKGMLHFNRFQLLTKPIPLGNQTWQWKRLFVYIYIYRWFSYENLHSVSGFSSTPCLMTPEASRRVPVPRRAAHLSPHDLQRENRSPLTLQRQHPLEPWPWYGWVLGESIGNPSISWEN